MLRRTLAVLLLSVTCSSQTMQQLKKTVGFVYGSIQTKDKDGKPMMVDSALGTCFFIRYPDTRGGVNYGFTYIVTAKHVLKRDEEHGKYFDKVRIRLNKADETGVAFTDVHVADESGNLLWLDDKDDPGEDIAVIFVNIPQKDNDYLTIPLELLSSPDSLKKSNVVECDPVYLAGLMPQFTGVNHNYPVVRHGYISLLSDEPIPIGKVKENVYALELGAWPGQSGSPVFLSFGGFRHGNMILGESYSLLGIMLGYFTNLRPIEVNPTNTLWIGDAENVGISYVLPAYEIMKVLNSKAAQEQRDADIKNIH
jgi:Trypsin-like peptidase domain